MAFRTPLTERCSPRFELRLAACLWLPARFKAKDMETPISPDLTVAVVTNSGSLDWESPLFQSGQAVVITHRSVTLPNEIRSIRAGETSVDLIDAIDQLQTLVPNDGFVQLEGGPTLNASLHQLDLIDAINLTMSPQLIGGAGQRMIESTDEHAYRFRLQHAVTDGDCLFTRWLRRSEAAS